jgi:DNA-binding CsgD family transcriptional regulator
MRYVLGVSLLRKDGLDVTLGLLRATGRPPYSPTETDRLERLVPHLQRSVRIYLETEVLRQRALIGERGLNAFEIGVLATDEAGRVVYANRRAEALLREGNTLKVREGIVVAAPMVDATHLDLALRRAASSGHPESVRIAVTGNKQDKNACYVTILPLAEQNPMAGVFGRPKLLWLVNQENHRRVLTGRQLIQLFALSPAEARLARAMAQGHTPEAYAVESSLSMATVRTQMRAVFAKTGTRRQPDLVRLLYGIPPTRDERAS